MLCLVSSPIYSSISCHLFSPRSPPISPLALFSIPQIFPIILTLPPKCSLMFTHTHKISFLNHFQAHFCPFFFNFYTCFLLHISFPFKFLAFSILSIPSSIYISNLFTFSVPFPLLGRATKLKSLHFQEYGERQDINLLERVKRNSY